jgi:hypothetical protein
VFHRVEPHERHVYYRDFRNRRNLGHDQIRQEAIRYCSEDIPKKSSGLFPSAS